MHTISLSQLYSGVSSIPGRTVKLTEKQRLAIEHTNGPLWIIAGPGSGKTEVLVLRCLKLLLVDGVDPPSIMITTFTEKAARNLKDRLISYKSYIEDKFPTVKEIDLFQLRVGTLHGLSNSIMLDQRFPDYKNYRALDDFDQLLFIYFNCPLASKGESQLTDDQRKFWNDFEYIWEKEVYSNYGYFPSKWIRARVLKKLFNRIAEDMIDLETMKKRTDRWKTLAIAYEEYVGLLDENFRVDFAHIQRKFLSFLDHPLGTKFIEGDSISGKASLKYVLVDEYQDTNPIQEAIYLELCKRGTHNLCIVGDDDQALYRFRGGTVECMVNFGVNVVEQFNCKIKQINLIENYRSHPTIVKWCNEFINSFDVMKKSGSRAPGKPDLIAKRISDGNYHGVCIIHAETRKQIALKFADAIKELLEKKIINDVSDCALLMRSTRNSRNWAAPFVESLTNAGINIYNPRSGGFIDEEEIQLALGTLLETIDPNPNDDIISSGDVKQYCSKWRNKYNDTILLYPALKNYVLKSRQKIQKLKPKEKVGNILDILYHILNHEPFVGWWLNDPSKTFRLGQLTAMIESYSSSPIPKYPHILRGDLRMSSQKNGEVSWRWLQTFYLSFITFLVKESIDDPENDDVICPPGFLPMMTVHQAKGLEFPFVFVAGVNSKSRVGTEHTLEDELRKFNKKSVHILSREERALQDSIRLYFVAYSRARYALIILADDDDLNSKSSDFISFGGNNRIWFNKLVKELL